jgi:RNA-splicing ligase RtcB
MITLNGKYNTALIYAKKLDSKSEESIKQYLDHPMFADTKVRVMPDVHAGVGCTVGFTATCNDYVVPSIIGVDIGCGVNAYNIGEGNISFDKLDCYIRKHIPSGRNINRSTNTMLEKAYGYVSNNELSFRDFIDKVSALSKKIRILESKTMASLGTLGGGNHFIEVDKDESGNRWLLIHSGSRSFGAFVSNYHQSLANKRTHQDSPIKMLTDVAAQEYMEDMVIAQLYAKVNRTLMAFQIGCEFFKVAHSKLFGVESVHNYIDFDYNMIRKGAISAQKGEAIVIPFSMADGAIIGEGKGNPEWNCSAPHGSGRKLSRTQAKEGLSVDEYRKRMKGIWSSCIGSNTVDESPMAYKPVDDVMEFLEDTVDVKHRLKPAYNFKAGE